MSTGQSKKKGGKMPIVYTSAEPVSAPAEIVPEPAPHAKPSASIYFALATAALCTLFLVYEEVAEGFFSPLQKARRPTDTYELNYVVFLDKCGVAATLLYVAVVERAFLLAWCRRNVRSIFGYAFVLMFATFVLEVVALAAESRLQPSKAVTRVAVSLQTFFSDVGYTLGFFSSFYVFIHDHLGLIRDAFVNVARSYAGIFSSVTWLWSGFVSYASYYSNQSLVYVGGAMLFAGTQFAAISVFRARLPTFFGTLWFQAATASVFNALLFAGYLSVAFNVTVSFVPFPHVLWWCLILFVILCYPLFEGFCFVFNFAAEKTKNFYTFLTSFPEPMSVTNIRKSI